MFFCWKTIFIPQGNRNFQLFALFSRIYFPAESGYTAGSSVSSLDRKLLFQAAFGAINEALAENIQKARLPVRKMLDEVLFHPKNHIDHFPGSRPDFHC